VNHPNVSPKDNQPIATNANPTHTPKIFAIQRQACKNKEDGECYDSQITNALAIVARRLRVSQYDSAQKTKLLARNCRRLSKTIGRMRAAQPDNVTQSPPIVIQYTGDYLKSGHAQLHK